MNNSFCAKTHFLPTLPFLQFNKLKNTCTMAKVKYSKKRLTRKSALSFLSFFTEKKEAVKDIVK
jgi:hypothetical protein